MPINEDEILKYLMARYKDQWDRNSYMREQYRTDLETYVSYRNPGDYPLAYNENFNRVLPIINTILSRFMDQLYQGGNIVSVKPRKRADLERAKKAEGVLNYQLEVLNDIDQQGGSYLTMMKWFFNALTFGKGIAKAYWRKEDRISPKRIDLPVPNFDRQGNFQGFDVVGHLTEEMQTVYDGPYVEVLHNKLFLPHPEYKNIQQMPQVFIIYQKTMDYVKRMADKGIYKNINQLGHLGAGGASAGSASGTASLGQDSREAFIESLHIESAFMHEDTNDPRKTPNVDIIEAYAKMVLEDTPYSVGSGIKIKGAEEEVIAHIGNYNTLLSLQKNTYGVRPLFDMGAYYHPELYWDLGLIQLTKGIQNQINNLANLRIQNAMMLINPMIKVAADADIDPEALVWKPFGIVPVEDMNDVEPLIVPDTNSNLFMEQEMFYKSAIQDIMGMYDYNMGQTPQRQERVGVVYGIQAMGEARAKLMLMSMDYLGIRPLLKYMMTLNTFHLPSGFEYRKGGGGQEEFGQIFGDDIHADFDFAARYTAMEPALGKQARSQQLVQMAGLWQQNPWVNQFQYTKLMMELLDIREADYLLKTPEQFQQEMQQRQESAMQAEQAKEQSKVQGKMTAQSQKSQDDLTRDLMLEAVKAGAVA